MRTRCSGPHATPMLVVVSSSSGANAFLHFISGSARAIDERALARVGARAIRLRHKHETAAARAAVLVAARTMAARRRHVAHRSERRALHVGEAETTTADTCRRRRQIGDGWHAEIERLVEMNKSVRALAVAVATF